MANPSKAKGTRAETRVVQYLKCHSIFAERKALAGSADQGDLRIITKDGKEITAEVKTGKQTHNYSRKDFETWKEQTIIEGINSRCPSVLIIVRYRRCITDAEVWLPNKTTGWTMMYLNEFVKEIGG